MIVSRLAGIALSLLRIFPSSIVFQRPHCLSLFFLTFFSADPSLASPNFDLRQLLVWQQR